MAMMETPWRSPFWTRLSVISPFLAYIRMLRAISEIAAAMTVCSPLVNPATAAKARPCCLASTTSTSAAITRRSSSPTAARLLGFGVERPFFGATIEEGETFFEVQHGRDAFQGQAELHHGERDVGLDAHDHGFGAPQPGHVRDVAQRAHGERVHHVERRDVDDDAAAARPPHLGDQRFTKMRKIGVGEGRLNGSDEKLPLPQNRYFHSALRKGCVTGSFRAGARAFASWAAHDPPAAARLLRCLPAGRRPWPSRSGPPRSSRESARFRATGRSRSPWRPAGATLRPSAPSGSRRRSPWPPHRSRRSRRPWRGWPESHAIAVRSAGGRAAGR